MRRAANEFLAHHVVRARRRVEAGLRGARLGPRIARTQREAIETVILRLQLDAVRLCARDVEVVRRAGKRRGARVVDDVAELLEVAGGLERERAAGQEGVHTELGALGTLGVQG